MNSQKNNKETTVSWSWNAQMPLHDWDRVGVYVLVPVCGPELVLPNKHKIKYRRWTTRRNFPKVTARLTFSFPENDLNARMSM